MTKAMQKNGRRMGRPTQEESKKIDKKLKSAAYKLFLEKGFDAVTVEAIAAAASVTKRTVYAKYKDKGELFSVVLRELKFKWPSSQLDSVTSEKMSLADHLSYTADALMIHTLDIENIKMARMASAKAAQFSVDIQQGFSMSPDPRMHSIIKILHAHAGEIQKKYMDDVEKTAELFIGLIIGIPTRLAGFGTIRDPGFEQARIKLAVEMFVVGICNTL